MPPHFCNACNCNVSQANVARHYNTKKHQTNARKSEKAIKERERRTIERQLNDEIICSIMRKLSVDDMKFILNHHRLVEDALTEEIDYTRNRKMVV